jgi:hypothetical protein
VSGRSHLVRHACEQCLFMGWVKHCRILLTHLSATSEKTVSSLGHDLGMIQNPKAKMYDLEQGTATEDPRTGCRNRSLQAVNNGLRIRK